MSQGSLKLKYVKIDDNGRYRYRRRVPQQLQKALGKSEFSKVLGLTDKQATLAYGDYHKQVEKELALARGQRGQVTPLENRDQIIALMKNNKLTLDGPGITHDEVTSREEYADRILNKYYQSEDTGAYEGVSPEDSRLVIALKTGIHAVEVEPTVTDAFELYLKEKKNPDPFKRKKTQANFRRVQDHALIAFGSNKPITQIKRSDARALRDRLLQTGMQPQSAKRLINNLKAAINFAAKEYDLPDCTCFRNLEYPESTTVARDRRNPLSEEVISAMYEDLRFNPTLLQVWTLIHHTGAQNAEILGLHLSDFQLDDDVPHIAIRPNASRGVKDAARIRTVPLLGEALRVAHDLKSQAGHAVEAFPKFANPNSHDNFSQQVMKRLRRFTVSKEHTLYSLRHNMKDALRTADISLELQNAILGHSLGSGAQANYGSGFSLEKKRDALAQVFAD